MGILSAWIEWSEGVPPGLGTAAAIALIVGEFCLLLDLGGRVLGTYARTPARIVARFSLTLLASAILAIPFLLAATRVAGWEEPWLVMSILLSLLTTVHFLLPYHFGIRRIGPPVSVADEQPLGRAIVLRRVGVEAPLPPESPAVIRCLVLSILSAVRDSFERLRGRRYDLVFVLGDLGENNGLLPDVVRAIAALRPAHGVFLVRGNHDCEQGRAELISELAAEHSIVLLANTGNVVPGLGIEVLGLERPWRRGTPPERSAAGFAIGLSHTPDNIARFRRLGVSVALVGHTHGGKLALPLLGRVLVPSKYGRFLDEGWFQLGDTRLYITPGLGRRESIPPRPGVMLDLAIADASRARRDAPLPEGSAP